MALSACNAFYMHRMAYRIHREKKIRVACILVTRATPLQLSIYSIQTNGEPLTVFVSGLKFRYLLIIL